ncbi:MAG: hypothetical protein JNM63_20060 [Spirochaetia bacterium]|nr:hypothetical protein [Spirochaetia bacterium]
MLNLLEKPIAHQFYENWGPVIDKIFQKPAEAGGFLHFLASHLYWCVLAFLTVLIVLTLFTPLFGLPKILAEIGWSRKKFWKFAAILFAIFTPLGWLFGIIIENHDPKMPAFYFLPWTCSNTYVFNQLIEDWIFYAQTTVLNTLYLIYAFYFSKKFPDPAGSLGRRFRFAVLLIALIGLGAVAFSMDFLGRVHGFLFAVPSLFLILWLYRFPNLFNTKILLFVFIPMNFSYVVFYDFLVIWAPSHIFGAPWAQAYVYIIPELWMHSTAYAPFPKGWIFKEFTFSAEIGMPFFGSYFWYAAALLVKKKLDAS